MSLRSRMVLVLGLVAVAVVTLVLGLPPYLREVREGLGDPAAVQAPAAFLWGGVAGLAALVLVLREQHRRREYGWVVASLVLSYLAIAAYAVRLLLRSSAGAGRAAA